MIDLLADRSRDSASAFECRLQLRVAISLNAEFLALIDNSPRRRKAFELAELRLDDFVGLGLFCLAAREAELALDFGDYIVNAGEIFFDPFELALAHLAASFEQRE